MSLFEEARGAIRHLRHDLTFTIAAGLVLALFAITSEDSGSPSWVASPARMWTATAKRELVGMVQGHMQRLL